MVTVRSGQPYDSWDIPGLARKAGLSLKTSVPFHPSMYPGYSHRRTIGFSNEISTTQNEDILRSACHTLVFWPREKAQEQAKAKKSKKKDDDDEEEDDDEDDDLGGRDDMQAVDVLLRAQKKAIK